MKNIFTYDTVMGRIGIAEKDSSITNVFFQMELEKIFKTPIMNTSVINEINTPPELMGHNEYRLFESPLLKEASEQLKQYFAGERKSFNLPLAPRGTAFMKNIWECLMRIPYGEKRSYKEIALASGNLMASRAVGMANNRNPLPFFIPCHRVIGSNGKLIGYRGGLDIKIKLLELEEKHADI